MLLIRKIAVCLLLLLTAFSVHGQHPRQVQVDAQQMEFYLFAHFGPNTFTGEEWGKGNEREEIFNPSKLDCRQWARIAKAAGAKGIIITAKHHDGFCLWPSEYSNHTVRQSKWRNGHGDVLKELSEACREYGIKFGVYLSPWDRNHPAYGTKTYNKVYMRMMKELFRNYGPIWELWWDGANGEGPNGKKQEYNWAAFRRTVRRNSPHTVVFSDVGPDLRWVGNEQGVAGTTNWNLLNTSGFTAGAGAPPADTLTQGNKSGEKWVPAECDVSIRPGWFYHAKEDSLVKTPEQLFQRYLKSVGRGANFLLNVPPTGEGLFSKADSAALMGFGQLRRQTFANNLAKAALPQALYKWSTFPDSFLTDGNTKTARRINELENTAVNLVFKAPQRINCVVIQEPEDEQRIAAGTLYIMNGTVAIRELPFTTIGHKRILTFPVTDATSVKLIVTEAKAPPAISELAVYKIPDHLIEH